MKSVCYFFVPAKKFTVLLRTVHGRSTASYKILTSGSVGCADLGLLDLLQLQDKLPGLLLYHVSLGGLNGDQLLQRGSIDTLLSLATGEPYPLNFSIDPTNAQRVRCSLIATCCLFYCFIITAL